MKTMRDFTWSATEKKIARAAFDRAYARECDAILRELRSMLSSAADSQAIWEVEKYLTTLRREIDSKYDYRYSVLILLFARLVHEQ